MQIRHAIISFFCCVIAGAIAVLGWAKFVPPREDDVPKSQTELFFCFAVLLGVSILGALVSLLLLCVALVRHRMTRPHESA